MGLRGSASASCSDQQRNSFRGPERWERGRGEGGMAGKAYCFAFSTHMPTICTYIGEKEAWLAGEEEGVADEAGGGRASY